MSDKINRALLADLVKLAGRYKAQDWEDLIEFLRDEHRREEISWLLKELSQVSGRTTARSPRSSRPMTVADSLERIRVFDPEKADLLTDLRQKLVVRELLPTAESLREFAEQVGIQVINQRKRQQAINDLVRHLAEIPYAEIKDALGTSAAHPRNLGREYERWVALILGKATERPPEY